MQWKLKDKWLGLKKEEKKAEDERSEKERKKKEREEEGRMLRKEMVEDWDKTERRDMAEGERQRADGSSVERDGMREEESAQEVGRLGESARDEEMEGAGEGAARGGGGAGKKRRKKNYWTKQVR